jgi:signal transduction histidine kinase
MNPLHWLPSLRVRLLAATVVSLCLALLAAHLWLGGLFRDHVMQQFDQALALQLDELTARLSFDDTGVPAIGPRGLSDPRWEQPYAGLYWQIMPHGAAAHAVNASTAPDGSKVLPMTLRSRSLWDSALQLPVDALADGATHRHDISGPRGEALRVLERVVQPPAPHDRAWRLAVAADPRTAQEAITRFQGVLAASLAGLGGLLVLAALAQVALGLAPLQAMQRGLQLVRGGQQARLQGKFPLEVQPLIDAFNQVLDQQADSLAKARAQAGNLAHGLKTPMAVLAQAATSAPPGELPALIQEQVQLAQRHMQWHLARARAAASPQMPGQRTPVQPLLEGLCRTLGKLHADRALQLQSPPDAADLAFAGEAQDLQEMVGNLLDNACRSARHAVQLRVERQGHQLCFTVEDDGPGIAPNQREAVLQRGVRLDETPAGSGLGLAIVLDLATTYGGTLSLGDAQTLGGLRACLCLPVAGTAT